MSQVFTDYVRSLTPEGAPPDAGSFVRLEDALRGALRSVIKQRGLWESPPSYLGVYGWRSWQEKGALEELAADCYSYVFLRRLRSLRGQLRVKSNIDGLIFRCIRHFLHETQKRQDPLGFRVFNLLRTAFQRLVDSGRLHLLRRGPEIGNATTFGFVPALRPFSNADRDFEAIVGVWSDELLPDLVTARGEAEDVTVARLEGLISGDLPDAGVEIFRFRDIIDPLKADVRARWAALFKGVRGETGFAEKNGGDLVDVVYLLDPDTSIEDRDSFDKLVSCVSRELDRLRVRSRTRKHLATYWQFLRTFVAERESQAEGVVEKDPGDGGEKLPSRRSLSRFLGIPRDRFPELDDHLRALLERCLKRRSGRPERRTAPPAASLSTPADPSERSAVLRRRTAAALGELVPETRVEEPSETWLPGDLFVSGATAAHDLEWLVTEVAGDGRLRLVPADTFGLAGSADARLGEDSALGPLTLRCRFAVRLSRDALHPSWRTGRLDRAGLERVRRRIEVTESGRPGGCPEAEEGERDPEYRAWQDDLEAAHRSLTEGGGPRCSGKEPSGKEAMMEPPRLRRWNLGGPSWWAVAALLVACLGLLRLWWSDRKTVLELSDTIEQLRPSAQPVVNLPLIWLTDDRQRGADEPMVIPAGTGWYVLVLQDPDLDPGGSTYRLEVWEAGGDAALLAWNGLSDNLYSEITLLVPRDLLQAGKYDIHLVREGEPEARHRFALELVLE